MRAASKPYTLLATAAALALTFGAPLSAGPAAAPVADATAEKFSVLSYDTLAPSAATLRSNLSDPARTMLDTRVDNEADFQAGLAARPDSVTLVTTADDAKARHDGFLALAGGSDTNIMVAVYGNLDDLEQFAAGSLGVKIADRITPAGETAGMLVVQYLRAWNFAYLLGDKTYHRGVRSFFPKTFPLTSAAPGMVKGTWWIELIRAALEEPFWNRVHYLSGHTLGCLGVDWDTAFKILFKWEVFEQKWGFGEDMWGVIWDLIWGMVGYIDGATGWWD